MRNPGLQSGFLAPPPLPSRCAPRSAGPLLWRPVQDPVWLCYMPLIHTRLSTASVHCWSERISCLCRPSKRTPAAATAAVFSALLDARQLHRLIRATTHPTHSPRARGQHARQLTLGTCLVRSAKQQPRWRRRRGRRCRAWKPRRRWVPAVIPQSRCCWPAHRASLAAPSGAAGELNSSRHSPCRRLRPTRSHPCQGCSVRRCAVAC